MNPKSDNRDRGCLNREQRQMLKGLEHMEWVNAQRRAAAHQLQQGPPNYAHLQKCGETVFAAPLAGPLYSYRLLQLLRGSYGGAVVAARLEGCCLESSA